MSICSHDAIKIHCRLTGLTCSKVPDFLMVGHALYINSSQKYMCSFVVTFWLAIFTYGQTFGVFIQGEETKIQDLTLPRF